MKKSSLMWVAVGSIVGGIVIGAAAVYGWFVMAEPNQATQANNTAETRDVTGSPEDERILLTRDNLGQYSKKDNGSPDCEADFRGQGAFDADETAAYNNADFGLSVEIPFNADWGTDQYRLSPFEDLDAPIDDGTGDVLASVQFGNMFVGEGCGWYRTHFLSIRKGRDVEEIKDALGQDLVATKAVTESTIPGLGLDAVEYDFGALCGMPTLEVLGKDYNIVIGAGCGSDPNDDYPWLRSVASSLVFK
ncbi:MAG: hypothetical protein V1895_03630 [Parcubacteria group bacterium]